MGMLFKTKTAYASPTYGSMMIGKGVQHRLISDKVGDKKTPNPVNVIWSLFLFFCKLQIASIKDLLQTQREGSSAVSRKICSWEGPLEATGPNDLLKSARAATSQPFRTPAPKLCHPHQGHFSYTCLELPLLLPALSLGIPETPGIALSTTLLSN